MMNTQQKFGPFNTIVLLGGGAMLKWICNWAKNNDYQVKVITSPRHYAEYEVEMLENVSLGEYLQAGAIEHLVTEAIDSQEVKDFIGSTDGKFFLSLGAAWIFSQQTVNTIFNNQLFNLHGSRLPNNRGGGGFSWQIMTGNKFGFFLMHRIDGGVDTGEILYRREFLYTGCRTPQDYENLYLQNAQYHFDALMRSCRHQSIELEAITQDECLSSYWPRLSTENNGWIDWSWSADELDRFICAFDDPYAGAQTYLGSQKVHLKCVSVNTQDGAFHPYQAGIVYRKSAEWFCVAVNDAALIIKTANDEQGKSILNKIKVGDRFQTPQDVLDSAKGRVVFTPTGMKC